MNLVYILFYIIPFFVANEQNGIKKNKAEPTSFAPTLP